MVRALPPTPNSLLLDHAPKVTPRLFSVSIFFAVALAVLRRPAFAPTVGLTRQRVPRSALQRPTGRPSFFQFIG